MPVRVSLLEYVRVRIGTHVCFHMRMSSVMYNFPVYICVLIGRCLRVCVYACACASLRVRMRVRMATFYTVPGSWPNGRGSSSHMPAVENIASRTAFLTRLWSRAGRKCPSASVLGRRRQRATQSANRHRLNINRSQADAYPNAQGLPLKQG